MTRRQWIVFGSSAVVIGIGAILTPTPESPVIGYSGYASFERRGETAPEFKLPVIEVEREPKSRREVSLSEFRGTPVVINVWATWCKPCVAEQEDLRRSARSHRKVQFLGVVYNDSDVRIRSFFRKNRRPGFPNLQSAGASFKADFRVRGVPITYFINRAGRFTRIIHGTVDEAVLDDAIKADFEAK